MQHILFFAGYRLKVFAIRGGRCRGYEVFEPGDEGFAAFRRYLRQQVRRPVRLLVDVIEEDFHLDSVPHVLGQDKKELHTRLLNKYLRGAEHRCVRVQGREAEGRRDDKVLIAGISNSELLKPWLALLDEQKIALAGIHSLPLLAEKTLSGAHGNVLLVSQQVPTSVRHSLYQDGQLKMSRLAQALGDENETEAQVAVKELDKTLRFIDNQRVLGSVKTPLQIHWLGSPESVAAWQQEAQQQGKTALLATAVEVQALGAEHSYADSFYAEYLARQRWPQNHYGHDRNLRIYYHKLAALGIGLLVLLCLLGGVLGNAWLGWQEHEERLAIPELKRSAQQYRDLYAARTGELAELKVEAADVKSSVELLAQWQQSYTQSPLALLNALSHYSKDFPELSIRHINWQVAATTGQSSPYADSLGEQGIKPQPFIAQVDAALLGFADSPRKALDEVNRLLVALRQQPGFESVTATKMPFDLASDTQFKMSGNSVGTALGEVEFSLRIRGRLP